ncbi:MAG: response regulator, partial [Magnetococcales bacterium]|nr:response regulator [Magnetococcales bacterium]
QDPSIAFNVLQSMAGKIKILGEGQVSGLTIGENLLNLDVKNKQSELTYNFLIDKVVQPSNNGGNFQILMIEDDPDYQILAQSWLADPLGPKFLSPVGPHFTLKQTDSLSKAIKILKEEKIDLIVLDLNLPDSSGLETISRLFKKAGNTPIVVFSGSNDEEQILLAARHGAEDYLIKGEVSKVQFIRSIRSALERSHVGEKLLRLPSHINSNHEVNSATTTI